MSQNTKIILIVIGVFVVLCCCAVAASMVLGLTVFNSAGTRMEYVGPPAEMEELERGLEDMQPGLDDLQRVLPEGGEDPQAALDAAGKITDFDLPDSFRPQYGLHFMGFDMAGFESGSNKGFIMLMQFPSNMSMDLQEMQDQMQNMRPGGAWSTNTEVVDTYTMEVRGAEQQVVISEGTDEQGDKVRVMTVPFEGKAGPALLMIIHDADSWDQALFDGFVQSLR